MTDAQSSSEPLELAQSLARTIERLDELLAFRFFIRRVVIALTISLIVDLFFTLGILQTQISVCNATNTTRGEQDRIWHEVFNDFRDPHPTPQEKTHEQRFLLYVDHTFKPVNCTRHL